MKNIKTFENFLNISNKRKFPSSYFDLYKVDKKHRGEWLNTWFPVGEIPTTIKPNDRSFYTNTIGTLKQTDKETSANLYHHEFNPVIISIINRYDLGKNAVKNKDKVRYFSMKAMIQSIDDSSYGIWFNEMPLETLEDIRKQIMKYVDSVKLLNGHKFIEFCQSLGGTDVDYN